MRMAASPLEWDGAGAAPTLPHPAAAFPALILNQLKENNFVGSKNSAGRPCVLRVGVAGSPSVGFWDCHQGAGLGWAGVTLLWPHRAWDTPQPQPGGSEGAAEWLRRNRTFFGGSPCLGFSSPSCWCPQAASILHFGAPRAPLEPSGDVGGAGTSLRWRLRCPLCPRLVL